MSNSTSAFRLSLPLSTVRSSPTDFRWASLDNLEFTTVEVTASTDTNEGVLNFYATGPDAMFEDMVNIIFASDTATWNWCVEVLNAGLEEWDSTIEGYSRYSASQPMND